MALTDIVTLCFSFLFLSRGFSRGLINSLLGPVAMIAATILSAVYYEYTKNLAVSLVIGLLGPLLLTLLLKFILHTWSRATSSDVKPDIFSRLGGAVLTLAWGWVFIIFTLLLFTMLPSMGSGLSSARQDVSKSVSYTRIAQPLQNVFFASAQPTVDAITAPASTFDIHTLSQDPRFQKVLQDPDVQRDIDSHNMVQLMHNPKILALTQQIMSDPATMKKVMAIYKNQLQPQAQ